MKPSAKQEAFALVFNALAHLRRQMIFQLLNESGAEGQTYKGI